MSSNVTHIDCGVAILVLAESAHRAGVTRTELVAA
jgi:hypothetical protein